MAETPEPTPGSLPSPPPVEAPIRKKLPLVFGLASVVLLFGLINLISLATGKRAEATKSSLPNRPSTANPQQVSSFETQQTLTARRDAEKRLREQQVAEQLLQLQAQEQALLPGPEAKTAAPMTPVQRAVIYGDNNPNAPTRTSAVSQAQAEAKERALAREKQHQDAINSDTVAVDFTPTAELTRAQSDSSRQESASASETGEHPTTKQEAISNSAVRAQGEVRDAALRRYDFDEWDGRLYRVFEGTVFEGVVTNHIDGGFAGPILIMLTTDYYSHDHQQLLLPQGTRLIGDVNSVASGQQRKLFVSFHRMVCPDGFSIDLDKFAGLDPLGTTGLATKVNHGYLTAFAAAAAIGGLGGLAQIGNGGIGVLGGDPGVSIRNGISAQMGQESEQILNHFLNRLPVITLKEGSRARVYIARDLLLPSYADHRVDPNL